MSEGSSSRVFAFGENSEGQLGVGSEEEKEMDLCYAKPVPVSQLPSSSAVYQVACGSNHTLFLLADGSVYSCGNNENNQLGIAKSSGSNGVIRERVPREIRSLRNLHVIQVACGRAHNLALTNTGHAFSWGCNSHGQLGLKFLKNGCCVDSPMEINLTEVVQVCCGYNHSLALCEDGTLYSWGDNKHGQLGLGHNVIQNLPQAVRSLMGVPVAQIAAGHSHTCILSVSAAVFTWGSNKHGQLGLGDSTDRIYPSHIKSLRSQRIGYISCGERHTAALTQEGKLFTYGYGTYGQLGHEKKEDQYLPRQVFELMGNTVTRVSCGRCHTLVLVEGKVRSFGLGSNGQLGGGEWKNATTPVLIDDLEAVSSIFTGADQSFVVLSQSCADVGKQHPGPPVLLNKIKHLEPEFVIQEASRNTLWNEFLKILESVYASQACLNCSFLLQGTNHYGASGKNCGVNMDAVMKSCQTLSESKHLEQICRIIRKALEWSLFPELPKSPPDIEALRLYIILPWCPVFDQMENYKNIHVPFATSLISLVEIPSRVLSLWWEKFEVRHFSRILRVFKGVVSYVLALPDPSKKDESSTGESKVRQNAIHVSLNVLKKLNQVNKKTHKIPFDMFYVNELVKKVDIRYDYIRSTFTKEKDKSSFSYCDYPFIFNGELKTTLLQTDAQLQMQVMVNETTRANIETMLFYRQPPVHSPFLVLSVSRNNLVEDTINQLGSSETYELKKPLKVKFHGEEADDAGGVKKEFFLLLFQELFHRKYGMFTLEEESRQIWFQSMMLQEARIFHLVGMLFGLAIYNGVLVGGTFPLALYKKILSVPVTLDDLKDLSPTEGRSLESILDYENDDFEEVFSLSFEIMILNFDSKESRELKEGGKNISVTKENRQEYVDLYVDYRLNKSNKEQFDSFNGGFCRVVTSRILYFFQPQELMEMVEGNENYDWGEFEKNTQYQGEYWRYHPTINLFWEVFHEMSLEEKKKFLLFLTGSDRIPLLGMNQLKMTIQPTAGGENYYPVAHTCFNLLDLPRTGNKEVMKEKLLTAIEHNKGFSLV